MAIENYGIDQGLRIYDPNLDTSVDVIKGNGVPGGDTGVQDDASIGSLFLRDSGELYKKRANGGAPSDWDRVPRDEALDIFLTSAYDNTTNGVPADGNSLELALGFMDANQLDIITLTGVAKGAVDLGTFSGSTIQDSRNIKQALQDLETGIENISGGSKDQALGVTALTRVGATLVDDSFQCEWEVVIEDAADESNRVSIKLNALHNGTASADATLVDHSRFARNKVGSNFNYDVDITLSGAAGTQDFAVAVSSTEPSGVNVYTRKTCLP